MKAAARYKVVHLTPEAHEALRYFKAKTTGEAGRTVTLSDTIVSLVRTGDPEECAWWLEQNR